MRKVIIKPIAQKMGLYDTGIQPTKPWPRTFRIYEPNFGIPLEYKINYCTPIKDWPYASKLNLAMNMKIRNSWWRRNKVNKYDLRDELPYWKWLLVGKFHPRTALHIFIPMLIIVVLLFLGIYCNIN